MKKILKESQINKIVEDLDYLRKYKDIEFSDINTKKLQKCLENSPVSDFLRFYLFETLLIFFSFLLFEFDF